jgi:hypothetical protein
MPAFIYQAADGEFHHREGVIVADTEADAAESLREAGLLPTSLWPAEQPEGPVSASGYGYLRPRWRRIRDDGSRLVYAYRSRIRLPGAAMLVLAAGAGVSLWWFGGRPSAAAAIGVALACMAVVGLAAMLLTGRIVVERSTKRLLRQWRLGSLAVRSRAIDGRHVAAVALEDRVVLQPGQGAVAARGGELATHVFAVLLQRTDGTAEQVEANSSQPAQRELAERLADYLGVPLRDGPAEAAA